VTTEFLDSIQRALTEIGIFRIATDQADYFEQIEQVAKNHSGFVIANDVDLPATKFERRFREAGLSIYRLSLRKISPVR
jgi:tRNA G46 methylase TrmB